MRDLITVLKNFARINENIYIRVGDTVCTRSQDKNIMARAKVDTEFTREVPIYNLTEFVNVMDLFDKPELELNERFLYIKDTNNRQRFAYSDPDLLVYPEVLPNTREAEVSFDVSKENYLKIKKAATVNKFNSILIVGKEGKIFLETTNIDQEGKRTANDNFFRIDIGQDTDREFEVILGPAFFAPIDDQYIIEVHMNLAKKIRYVKMHNVSLEYWIAMNKHSTMQDR